MSAMIFAVLAMGAQQAPQSPAPITPTTNGESICPTTPMFRYYPERASRSGITGKAVVNCNILSRGKLDQCVIVKEEPEGEGFGATAVLMAQCLFKVKPGQSGRMDVPIRFTLPTP
jgi:protein TonB